MITTDEPRDRRRAAALAATAATQSLVPVLGPLLLGTRENVDDYDTVITPPPYAFAIWGPIFAGTAAHAVQQALPRYRESAVNRRSGWPLVAAYALNTAWSVAAQTDRFALTPGLLSASTTCTAVAFRRLQGQDIRGEERLAPAGIGLLLGWTSLASAVNVLAASQLLGARPSSRASVATAAIASLAVSGGLSRTVSRSTNGRFALAGAVTWGLATTALDRRRPAVARIACALGGLTVVAAARANRGNPRTRSSTPDGGSGGDL